MLLLTLAEKQIWHLRYEFDGLDAIELLSVQEIIKFHLKMGKKIWYDQQKIEHVLFEFFN